jgi:cell shape-determining protein MreC
MSRTRWEDERRPTKRFEDDKATQPMLSELLAEMRAARGKIQTLREEQQSFRAELNARFEHLEIRIDRIESMTNQTCA